MKSKQRVKLSESKPLIRGVLFISNLKYEEQINPDVNRLEFSHRHLSREETERALDGLEASSLWLSARIYQEARQALDDIYAIKR